MTRRLRIVPSHLSPGERRVYVGVAVFFVALFVALIWPVYPLFSGLRPLVLGVPLSLAYVVALLLLGFGVLLGLFVWEGRRLDRDGRRLEPEAPRRTRAEGVASAGGATVGGREDRGDGPGRPRAGGEPD
ncbi:MAG: hypothetical protein ACLF0P_13070 [Thermoanaerobaculia bacterium]